MYLSEFFDLKLSNVLGLLISTTTLFLAYRIYRNFDVKKSYINKQLNTVLSLVEEINNTQILVKFFSKIPSELLSEMPNELRPKNREDAVLDSWYYSLFLIAQIDIAIMKQEVYLSTDIMNVLPFLHYMNNPLIPSKIANKLHKFYSPLIYYGSFKTASDKYVELNPTSNKGHIHKFQYPSNETYKDWNNFIFCAKELKQEINDWLEKYGSRDINFNKYMQRPK